MSRTFQHRNVKESSNSKIKDISKSKFRGNLEFEILKKLQNRILKENSNFGNLGELWDFLNLGELGKFACGNHGNRPGGTAGGDPRSAAFIC